MTSFEILPEGAVVKIATAESFVWPTGKGATSTVVTDVGAWLGSLGAVPPVVIDLVRIAAGAYMADRRSPRGEGFTRTISLHVQLVDTTPWADAVAEIAGLLHWLTGDAWQLELTNDGLPVPAPPAVEPLAPVATVALLSGGLDSFCGAALSDPDSSLFLGHWDNPTVKGAQNSVKRWLDAAFGRSVMYEQIRVVQANQKRESSSRSRALLFMALAVALAVARSAESVEIPENGYTSLNPPLGPERGGALSTRSTHPQTIARFNALLEQFTLNVRVRVPYADLTKGQLVKRAAAVDVAGFEAGVASTLSCGKLDGARYRGGNPNYHCGLCFPCIVRRGAIAAAGVADETPYLSNTLTGDALAKLRHNRSGDVTAVRRALIDGFADDVLIALGPFPNGFDIDSAADLCVAGLAELRNVDLD